MFPRCIRFIKSSSPFLCLRRGVSLFVSVLPGRVAFSLPTQRCFYGAVFKRHGSGLFSAYAEVFLHGRPRNGRDQSFLCLRRGVSQYTGKNEDFAAFSLPTQRCFRHRPLLARCGPTFLCLRRGVSYPGFAFALLQGFSLPTQRCFFGNRSGILCLRLFSAYAEVFPACPPSSKDRPAFLCLRRGVSRPGKQPEPSFVFSLPTQRCFHGS